MQATEIIFEEIERIRMHASAGLSVFQNLDLLTGYDLALSHLEAIERAVVAIDCAKDLAIPVSRILGTVSPAHGLPAAIEGLFGKGWISPRSGASPLLAARCVIRWAMLNENCQEPIRM